jgi:hypothetical protein
MKAPEWLWKLRAYPQGRFASLWLIRRDGPADSAVMWGEMIPALAEEIVRAFSLPVEREGSPYEVKPAVLPECVTVEEQRSLFEE